MQKQLVGALYLVLTMGLNSINATSSTREELHMAARNNCDKMWQAILVQQKLEAPDAQSTPEDIADYKQAY